MNKKSYLNQISHEKTLGLSLSGGGARGYVHIGVLKAFEEYDIKVSLISGTSMGALVATFWASGYASTEILEIFQSVRWLRLLHWNWQKGMLSQEKIHELLSNWFERNNFDVMKIPTFINATDLLKGETVYFHEGELIEPLIASLTVPGLMMPFLWKNFCLVDGGILQNLPVEILKENGAEYLVGVHSNPLDERMPKNNLQVLQRTLVMAMGISARRVFPLCDLVIEPPQMTHYNFIQIKKAHEIVEVGYEYTKKILERTL